MQYTTSWARQSCKTLSQWQSWVNGLTYGEYVLFQQFIPRGNSCLESQIQCWRFWPAIYKDDLVYYDNYTHPIKNGIAIYWNSEKPHGDVFASRIVPYHHDLTKNDRRFLNAHAPVFEPDWFWKDECHIFIPYQEKFNILSSEVRRKFPRSYSRTVNNGRLCIIFAEEEHVKNFASTLEGVIYCYSECLEF